MSNSNKYKFTVDGHRVIASRCDSGFTFKGEAICYQYDNSDIEQCKKRAAKRCEERIALIREVTGQL